MVNEENSIKASIFALFLINQGWSVACGDCDEELVVEVGKKEKCICQNGCNTSTYVATPPIENTNWEITFNTGSYKSAKNVIVTGLDENIEFPIDIEFGTGEGVQIASYRDVYFPAPAYIAELVQYETGKLLRGNAGIVRSQPGQRNGYFMYDAQEVRRVTL